MRKKISIFMVISLLSSHAFSWGNSGPLKNAWTVLSLGFSTLMRRGDQELFDAIQRLQLEITTAQNPNLDEQETRFLELGAAYHRYADFIYNHGGNLEASGPLAAQELVRAALDRIREQLQARKQAQRAELQNQARLHALESELLNWINLVNQFTQAPQKTVTPKPCDDLFTRFKKLFKKGN